MTQHTFDNTTTLNNTTPSNLGSDDMRLKDVFIHFLSLPPPLLNASMFLPQ
jgi:hypothetical protein